MAVSLLDLWLRPVSSSISSRKSKHRFPRESRRFYRPLLEQLEDRTPPGDLMGGASSSWLKPVPKDSKSLFGDVLAAQLPGSTPSSKSLVVVTASNNVGTRVDSTPPGGSPSNGPGGTTSAQPPQGTPALTGSHMTVSTSATQPGASSFDAMLAAATLPTSFFIPSLGKPHGNHDNLFPPAGHHGTRPTHPPRGGHHGRKGPKHHPGKTPPALGQSSLPAPQVVAASATGNASNSPASNSSNGVSLPATVPTPANGNGASSAGLNKIWQVPGDDSLLPGDRGFGAPGIAGSHWLFGPIAALGLPQQSIGSNSLAETWQGTSPGPLFPLTPEEKQLFVWDAQGRVLVNVRSQSNGGLDQMKQDLIGQVHMVVTGTTPAQNMVTGFVAPQDVMSILNVTGYAAATPTWAPIHRYSGLASQGVGVIQADTYRGTNGVDGTGVTVGVISDSVNQINSHWNGITAVGLAESQALGALPTTGIQVLQDGNASNTDEGRAILEVVHAVAPGAGLAFTTSDYGPQAMAQGIQNLVAQTHASVIVDDTAFPNEPFWNDGVIGRAVNQVSTSDNVVYVTAAGNEANHGWQDTWRPVTTSVGSLPNQTFQNFDTSGQGTNILQHFSLQQGQSLNLVLQWDSAFLEGGAPQRRFQVPNNLNVVVTSADGAQIYATYDDVNQNTGEALQRVFFTNNGTYGRSDFALAISLASGAAPTNLKWIRFDNNAPAQYQGASTIFGHAGDLNALTVAAVPYGNPQNPEPFTSQGPVTQLFNGLGKRLPKPFVSQNKPDLAAPDNIDTSSFPPRDPSQPLTQLGQPPFSGTSAAAAHAAGAAALLRQQDPRDPALDIRGRMQQGTQNVGRPGRNGQTGFGLLHLERIAGVTATGQVVDVTQAPGSQTEVAISVNPTNPQNLFLQANDLSITHGSLGSPAIFIARSVDGGQTWIDKRRIGTGAAGDAFLETAGDPSVSFDKYGNLFMTYIDENNGPAGAVDVYLSTDGGATFRLQATIPGSSPAAGIDQPTVVTGPNVDGTHGSVWINFNDANNNLETAVGAPVNGLGQVGAFSSLFTVPNATSGNFGDIAIGPQGQVMVAWQHSNSRKGPDDIEIATKTDGFGNGSFSTPTVVTNVNIGGFAPILAQPNRSIDSEVGLAWDRSRSPHNGRIYLMYTDAPSVAQNDQETNVFVRFSDNGGATWSNPARVNDNTNTAQNFLPKIALDQTTGEIAVSFYSTRNDTGQGAPNDRNGVPNNDPEFFGSFSFDGECFQKNIQITTQASTALPDVNQQFDFGDYTGAAFEAGVFHPAWSDNSGSLGVSNPDGQMEIATVSLQAPSFNTQDAFEPDETSDRAHNFGTLPSAASQSLQNLTIAQHASGLPDYDWFRWTMGAAGTFTANFNITSANGPLEMHLFTLDANNTLIELGTISSAGGDTCSFSAPLSAQVRAGQPILVEVKGANTSLGFHSEGDYNLTVNLQ